MGLRDLLFFLFSLMVSGELNSSGLRIHSEGVHVLMPRSIVVSLKLSLNIILPQGISAKDTSLV